MGSKAVSRMGGSHENVRHDVTGRDGAQAGGPLPGPEFQPFDTFQHYLIFTEISVAASVKQEPCLPVGPLCKCTPRLPGLARSGLSGSGSRRGDDDDDECLFVLGH